MGKDISNKVELTGEIMDAFEFSHEMLGEKFYIAKLLIERLSTAKDIIPIMVSERIVNIKEKWTGRTIKIAGQFRSYNKYDEEGKNHLILSVFAMEFEDDTSLKNLDKNNIYLDGFICKPTSFRKTPFCREIADMMLAVNRAYGKTDYIPCIAWGRNARFANYLEVGTRLKVWGRIQNREYQKKISDDKSETRTAYEVSVSKLEVVEETI